MARYDPFKGKTVRDLIDLSPSSIASMAERELRALVTRLSSAANKRVRSIERKDLFSPSIKKGERFSGKGKNFSQLQGEFYKLQRFLGDVKTTVRGARIFRSETHRTITNRFGLPQDFFDDMAPEEEKRFWELFNRWYESGTQKGVFLSKQAQEIKDSLQRANYSIEDAEVDIREMIDRSYEERKLAREDYNAAPSNIL